MTACTRSRSPSFMRTFPTWVFTVASPTNIRAAISLFVRPSAISSSASRSRAVSVARYRASRGRAGVPTAPLEELGDEPAGHRRSQQRLTRSDDLDRLHQLPAGGVLEQESAGAG